MYIKRLAKNTKFGNQKNEQKLAINNEKRIQIASLRTMKLSKREISRKIKVSNTAVHTTIKNVSKRKYF